MTEIDSGTGTDRLIDRLIERYPRLASPAKEIWAALMIFAICWNIIFPEKKTSW